MIFIYDKQNDLKIFAKLNKNSLASFYMTEKNRLISIDVFLEKNKTNHRKVITEFDKDVKLWFSSMSGYEYIVRAISKNTDYIEFPNKKSRIESDFLGNPKLTSIKQNLVDEWIVKIRKF